MLELYFKYPRVLRRLRDGELGGEMDRIAGYISEAGYKRESAKIYLSRLGRFSDHLSHAACNTPIGQAVVDAFVDAYPTKAPRQAAHTAIELARRVVPERFIIPCVEPDPRQPFLDAYLNLFRDIFPAACCALMSDFDTCFQNLSSNQPLMVCQKVVGTTNAWFGQFSPVYGSAGWAGEAGGG